MKNLLINLPEWTKDKNIYVFAGTELIAYKMFNNDLKTKVERCSGCGECCESGNPFKPIQWALIQEAAKKDFNDSDSCPFLGLSGCQLTNNIPFSCAKSDCSIAFKSCTERFE